MNGVRAPEEESGEAERKYRVGEAGAEILPERRSCSRIVRREEHGQHEEEAEEACGTHENAENERYPGRQFTVSHEEGDGCSVRKNKTTQKGRHKGVMPTLEKFVDPDLQAAVKRKSLTDALVLPRS